MIRLSFTELITVQTVRGFVEMLERSIDENPGSDTIEITMCTPGGDVELAIGLYNFLRSLGCRIITVNSSFVNSAGIIIFLAGDDRVCMPASSFFLHSVTKKLNGEYDAEELEREVKEIRTNTSKITTLLESHTVKKRSYWARLMKIGTILQQNKAIDTGLATISR